MTSYKFKKISKKILIIITALLVIAILTFLIVRKTSNLRYSGTLNVLNWTSYIPNEVIRDFEKEYNIKVNYLTYSSNEELLAKITSSNEGTYDVVFPSDYAVSLMKERDLLEKIDKNRLANFQNIEPLFLGQNYDENNEYSLPFLLATTIIAYDSEKYPNITSYKDLFSKKLKNSLILVDDQRVVIGAMLNTLGYSTNDTNDQHLEESLKLFDALKPNIKAFDSDSPKTFFITEEADAGIVWSAEAKLAAKSRPSIAAVYPEEGFVISMDNYCIPKNAKNKENAYLFIDYLLRDNTAEKIIAEYPYISSNATANTLSEIELNEIFTRGTYIENLGSNLKKYDKLWAKYK